MVSVGRAIAVAFYLIGVVGFFNILNNLGDLSEEVSAFFKLTSFDSVVTISAFIFLLANVSIGVVIHLLAEILNQSIISNSKEMLSKANNFQNESVNSNYNYGLNEENNLVSEEKINKVKKNYKGIGLFTFESSIEKWMFYFIVVGLIAVIIGVFLMFFVV